MAYPWAKKASCILINNVIHPGPKALNPDILAFFPCKHSPDPGKDDGSIFPHSPTHAFDASKQPCAIAEVLAMSLIWFNYISSGTK